MKEKEIQIELEEDNLEIDIENKDNQDINFSQDSIVYKAVDYEDLKNLPQVNGVVLKGDKSLEDLGIINDLNYVHTQNISSEEWVIVHNLNKYPSVTVLNSAGDEVIGDVFYNSKNQITITFKGAFKGTATLN